MLRRLLTLDYITVDRSDDEMTYKVKVKGDAKHPSRPLKTFKGETAWSDALRFTNDNLPWNEAVNW